MYCSNGISSWITLNSYPVILAITNRTKVDMKSNFVNTKFAISVCP